jgi:hypothetical protein
MEWNLFVLIAHIYICFCVRGVPKIGKDSIVFTVCSYSGVTCPSPFLPCASLEQTAVTAQASSFRLQYFSLICNVPNMAFIYLCVVINIIVLCFKIVTFPQNNTIHADGQGINSFFMVPNFG